MRLVRSIIFNSTYQLAGKIITSLSTLFISGILARSLGADGYGQFAIMTTYAAAFYAAADFGFNAVALRLASGNQSQIISHFQKLLGLRILYATALIGLAATILNLFPYSPTLKIATIVTCLTILTNGLYSCANLIFQFKLRYDLSSIALVAGSIINLALIFLLAQGNISLVLIALSYVAAGVITTGTALTLVRTTIGRFSPSFDWNEWKTLTLATLPVGLTLIFNLVYFRADTFVLSFMKPISDVGTYGAAYKLFEVALTPPTFFLNALYPILISKFNEDRLHFQKIVRYSSVALASASAAAAIIGIGFAPFIIHLIYGEKFNDSILPFRILLASLPIFYLSNLYMWLLILLKKQTPMFYIYTLGMIINVLLNLYFIPHFTYIASALITGVSEALILICTFFLARSWSEKVEQVDA